MSTIIRNLCFKSTSILLCRSFSVSSTYNKDYSCKVLVVGGGSGGCTIASKFSRRLGKDAVIVLEPSTEHYYQPLWTLVGAGVKTLADTMRPESSVLPQNAIWLKDKAAGVKADDCKVTTEKGDIINYEYIVIAVGLQNYFEKIPGLKEALQDPKSGVSTIYSKDYCEKTWTDISKFNGGEAIFTFPDTPIKCPGAPQKIAYMADSYFHQSLVRSKTKIMYNTALPVIFGVKKYADELVKVAARKQIEVNYKHVLKEVRRGEAVFVNADDRTKESTFPFKLLHVAPPLRPPPLLPSSGLTDSSGLLDVDKYSLRHKKYENVFGIGDCTNTPNSKTAAAISKQSYVLEQNLLATMQKNEPKAQYDGYGACPLVTSYGTCIVAEFLYDGAVHETFPWDQSKESRIAWYMKKDLFPFIYWNFMLKGYYHGPEFVRKIINPLGK